MFSKIVFLYLLLLSVAEQLAKFCKSIFLVQLYLYVLYTSDYVPTNKFRLYDTWQIIHTLL